MTQAYEVLGQEAPAANTDADLYTASVSTVCSTLSVCNLAGTATTFRIAVRKAGAALANKQYFAYDTALPANETIPVTVGFTLAADDVVTVRSGSGNVAFGLFGSKVAP